MNADYLRTRLMEFMQAHKGRENAIPRERVLSQARGHGRTAAGALLMPIKPEKKGKCL
jgi:hypothetical protein